MNSSGSGDYHEHEHTSDHPCRTAGSRWRRLLRSRALVLDSGRAPRSSLLNLRQIAITSASVTSSAVIRGVRFGVLNRASSSSEPLSATALYSPVART